MIICGIDPGTQYTGFGILDIERDRSVYRNHGVIRPKSKNLDVRLKEIFLRITDILQAYQPAEAAIETSFYATNAQTALKLGQVRGVIILAVTLLDIPVFEYTPTEVKKATCGYGHAEKGQISTMVHTLLGIPKGKITSQDASDALAVSLCHVSSRRMKRLTA
ncbi:MAG: crossover junction endodeoxyribonuclease RuvC [Syntrophaceae bacterium]